MKFTITREKLQEGLAAVAGSIPTRTTLPVLSNLLLETEEGGCAERDRSGHRRLDPVRPTSRSPGAITAPARKLQEIARELPPAPVGHRDAGRRDHDHQRPLALQAERAAADEFPAFPNGPFERESWKLTGKELSQLITHVSFAVSTEETRPILNGVLWELRGGRDADGRDQRAPAGEDDAAARGAAARAT
jgi:DNA polymerase III subunit beta